MDVREFFYDLPSDLIAQEPAARRSCARLLCLDRRSGAIAHSAVSELPDLLRAGDVLVVNNTRVFPARLLGRRIPSGGAVECMLLHRLGEPESGRDPHEAAPPDGNADPGQLWEALVHPGQKLKPGAEIVFAGEMRMLHGRVLERRFHGRRVIRLWTDDESAVDEAIDAIGHVPLPPYIKRRDRLEDRERYQTVFARERGSVAAPTAGLHFNGSLLAALAARSVDIVEITLHVGYGTFQPVRVERVEDHRLEPEHYRIDEAAAALINRALSQERRIIAVGTTTTRALEAGAATPDGRVVPGTRTTDLFIYPDFDFRVISGLLTNFHLPQSSLLMLVAAFAGREHVLAAYRAAVAEHYRFYSYGDAMLIL
jgi:S-adenosylmethionine:tRNA ribosyltransferase-isomerase